MNKIPGLYLPKRIESEWMSCQIVVLTTSPARRFIQPQRWYQKVRPKSLKLSGFTVTSNARIPEHQDMTVGEEFQLRL